MIFSLQLVLMLEPILDDDCYMSSSRALRLVECSSCISVIPLR